LLSSNATKSVANSSWAAGAISAEVDIPVSVLRSPWQRNLKTEPVPVAP
jgi:hypothetical protein